MTVHYLICNTQSIAHIGPIGNKTTNRELTSPTTHRQKDQQDDAASRTTMRSMLKARTSKMQLLQVNPLLRHRMPEGGLQDSQNYLQGLLRVRYDHPTIS